LASNWFIAILMIQTNDSLDVGKLRERIDKVAYQTPGGASDEHDFGIV
jgi:hypothetical protein